jgi:hypothetical protein
MKYCAGCGYCIEHVSEPRCPECGRSFDPLDPTTFVRPMDRTRLRACCRRVLVWVGMLALAYGLLIAGRLSWMYFRYHGGWAREEPVAKMITALGGRFVGRRPGALSFWDHLRGRQLDYLRARVVGVILSDTQVRDADLRCLVTLGALHYLDLQRTAVTDAGLRHLPEVSDLWELRLASTKITDAGLPFVAGLPLTCLDLSNTRITDHAVGDLQSLSGLKYLDVTGTRISPASIEKLRSSRPGLTVIGP